MNNANMDQKSCEDDMYLKWLVVAINGKEYRKYKLDYHAEGAAGILEAINEFIVDENVNCTRHIDLLDLGDNEWDLQELCPSSPEGKVDIIVYYSSCSDDVEIETLPEDREELNSRDWSRYIIDFTGIGSSEMPGYYHYNWCSNRAVLAIDSVLPGFLSTLIIILLRYHKSIFHLITEINMYKTASLQGDNEYQDLPEDSTAKPAA